MSAHLGLIEACRLIQSKALDEKKYLQDCYDLADLLEPQLKAFVTRSTIDALQKSIHPGALSAIPVGIKDIISTKDLLTTNGSVIYQNNFPKENAPIVEKLFNLGGVLFGKTVSTEFAYRKSGPTKNPWNHQHTPGGSSSGSAAAVAAGIVPLAIGTQTQGSVIRPAAFCGVVGFKPSFGILPIEGIFPFSGSLDHVGLFTRSVDDVAYAFDLLQHTSAQANDHVKPELDLYQELATNPNPRLAYLKTPFDHFISQEQALAIQHAISKLRSEGVIVDEVELPALFWDSLHSMTTLMFYEAAVVHQHHVKEFKHLLSEHIQNLVTQGQAITAIEYANAKNTQSQMRQSVVPYLSQYDALLTIPANGEAPLGLSSTGDPMFCSLWSFLGLPAITMPIAKSRNNLPLGLQLVGKMAQDQLLLQTAKTVQTICLFDLYQS